MKTADEMYEFCKNNYNDKINNRLHIFEDIVEVLPDNEEVIMCFTGYIDLQSIKDINNKLYGFAVTNQRIIMCQQKKVFDINEYKLSSLFIKKNSLTAKANIKSISLDMVNDISISTPKITRLKDLTLFPDIPERARIISTFSCRFILNHMSADIWL